MFASLGRFVYRRRVPVALAWVLVLGVGIGVGGEVFGRLGTGSGLRDDAESVVVADLLSRVAGGGSGITGLVDGRPAADPAFQAEIAAAVDDLEATPGVGRVTSPWVDGREVPGLVAADGGAVLVRVELEAGLRGATTSRRWSGSASGCGPSTPRGSWSAGRSGPGRSSRNGPRRTWSGARRWPFR